MILPLEIGHERTFASEHMQSRMRDIETICVHCSPATAHYISLADIFHDLHSRIDARPLSRGFFFDLSTWVNIAWRYLANHPVENLDGDREWQELMERLQGAKVALAFESGRSFSGNLSFAGDNTIKVFGYPLELEAYDVRNGITTRVTLVPGSIAGKLANNIRGHEMLVVQGVTISIDKLLSDSVAEIGYDATRSVSSSSEFIGTIFDALKLVRVDEENRNLVEEYVSSIVPLENPNNDEHQSLSIDATPGCIYVGKNCSVTVFAEAIVHEADHQRLYEIRRWKPFVDGASTKRFYSPWRMDPRPAGGLIFGASAFSRVSKFWHELRSSEHDKRDDTAGYRAVFTAMQSELAIRTVLTGAELTSFGRQYCETLGRNIADHMALLSNENNFGLWEERSSQQINEHRIEWARVNASADT